MHAELLQHLRQLLRDRVQLLLQLARSLLVLLNLVLRRRTLRTLARRRHDLLQVRLRLLQRLVRVLVVRQDQRATTHRHLRLVQQQHQTAHRLHERLLHARALLAPQLRQHAVRVVQTAHRVAHAVRLQLAHQTQRHARVQHARGVLAVHVHVLLRTGRQTLHLRRQVVQILHVVSQLLVLLAQRRLAVDLLLHRLLYLRAHATDAAAHHLQKLHARFHGIALQLLLQRLLRLRLLLVELLVIRVQERAQTLAVLQRRMHRHFTQERLQRVATALHELNLKTVHRVLLGHRGNDRVGIVLRQNVVQPQEVAVAANHRALAVAVRRVRRRRVHRVHHMGRHTVRNTRGIGHSDNKLGLRIISLFTHLPSHRTREQPQESQPSHGWE